MLILVKLLTLIDSVDQEFEGSPPHPNDVIIYYLFPESLGWEIYKCFVGCFFPSPGFLFVLGCYSVGLTWTIFITHLIEWFYMLLSSRMFMRQLLELFGTLPSIPEMHCELSKKVESLPLFISVLLQCQRWQGSWLHWHWHICLMEGKPLNLFGLH